MKFIAASFLLLQLTSSVSFGTDKIQTITITTPVFHTWDEGEVKFAKIPHTGWDTDNPYYFSAYYSTPFIVLEGSKHLKQDISLISIYQLQIQSFFDNGKTTIFISTANAKKPNTHHFTINQVIAFTTQAIRSDFPNKKKHLIKVTKKPIKDLFKKTPPPP